MRPLQTVLGLHPLVAYALYTRGGEEGGEGGKHEEGKQDKG